jgi:hypothetical protein
VIRYLQYGLALLLALALATPLSARADDSKEYLVKAAFIYNFTKFVQWPGDKAIGGQSNIDICMLGNSPLIATSDVFKKASTPKLSLSLVEEKSWREAPGHCHIVFISTSQESQLGEMLAFLKDRPVLTVSDMGGFANRGGMIGFVLSDNKIKLEINTRALNAAGMKVDAQLLEIALRVIDR